MGTSSSKYQNLLNRDYETHRAAVKTHLNQFVETGDIYSNSRPLKDVIKDAVLAAWAESMVEWDTDNDRPTHPLVEWLALESIDINGLNIDSHMFGLKNIIELSISDAESPAVTDAAFDYDSVAIVLQEFFRELNKEDILEPLVTIPVMIVTKLLDQRYHHQIHLDGDCTRYLFHDNKGRCIQLTLNYTDYVNAWKNLLIQIN